MSWPHCETCQHWQRISMNAKHNYANENPNIGRCTLITVADFTKSDDVSVEGDGYIGTLWCGPKYGCVKHEAKE